MKIITFNIRFDEPADGKHQWCFRAPLVAKYVKGEQPELLGTQEGKEPQLRQLQEALPDLQLVEGHRKWIAQRMYPCIFFSPKELSLLDSGDIWLSKTPDVPGSVDFDSHFPRLCTWALFQRADKNVFFLNTHLDHVYHHTRSAQIDVLIQELKKVIKPEYLLFICGDFNESPLGEVRKKINQKLPELTDSWQDLGHEEATTSHKFKGSLPPEQGGARIDWILSDKRAVANSIHIDKTSTDGIYPSDHFPVCADFKL